MCFQLPFLWACTYGTVQLFLKHDGSDAVIKEMLGDPVARETDWLALC